MYRETQMGGVAAAVNLKVLGSPSGHHLRLVIIGAERSYICLSAVVGHEVQRVTKPMTAENAAHIIVKTTRVNEQSLCGRPSQVREELRIEGCRSLFGLKTVEITWNHIAVSGKKTHIFIEAVLPRTNSNPRLIQFAVKLNF